MATEYNRNTRLQKLSNSDFEIMDGEPDIRGWDVKDASGRQIGEVEELIFDVQSCKVRYLVVDLDDNEFDLDDKEVLVPIGVAELHKDDDDVILNGVTPEQLSALPEYDEDRFDDEHENSIRNIFGSLGAGAAMAGLKTNEYSDKDDFYSHEHFNDENLYKNRSQRGSNEISMPDVGDQSQMGKREGGTGGMRLRSRIVDNDAKMNTDENKMNRGMDGDLNDDDNRQNRIDI